MGVLAVGGVLAVFVLCRAPSHGREHSYLNHIISSEMSLEVFMSEVYERKPYVFRHQRSLLPEVGLDTVADWIENDKALDVEVLGAPLAQDGSNARGYGPEQRMLPSAPVVRQKQAAAYLEAGHSFVFNTLQVQSPTLRHFARELYQDLGAAVDVYMYLAPPNSSAYGGHYDEMDAFMVQLEGSKEWEVCEHRLFSHAVDGSIDPQATSMLEWRGGADSCRSVTLRGGDVLYVPFSSPHKVRTGASDLSAHLTVNVERQFHTAACFLRAMAYRVAHGGALGPREYDKYMQDNPFGFVPFGALLTAHMSALPALTRVPARGLQYALDAADVSDSAWHEARSALEGILAMLLKRLQTGDSAHSPRVVDFAWPPLPDDDAAGWVSSAGRRTMSTFNVLKEIRARLDELLPFALDVDRHHRLASSTSRRSLPLAQSFGAAAALRIIRLRSHIGSHGNSSRPALLRRTTGLHASLLAGERADQMLLTVQQHTVVVPAWGVQTVRFCLCTAASGTARGEAFALGELGSTLPHEAPHSAIAHLARLLLSVGALEVVFDGDERAGAPAVDVEAEHALWRQVLQHDEWFGTENGAIHHDEM